MAPDLIRHLAPITRKGADRRVVFDRCRGINSGIRIDSDRRTLEGIRGRGFNELENLDHRLVRVGDADHRPTLGRPISEGNSVGHHRDARVGRRPEFRVVSIADEREIAVGGMIDRLDASGDGVAVPFNLAVHQQGDPVRGAGRLDSKPEFVHPPFPLVAFMRSSRMSVISNAREA